jgi:hypothetical protein
MPRPIRTADPSTTRPWPSAPAPANPSGVLAAFPGPRGMTVDRNQRKTGNCPHPGRRPAGRISSHASPAGPGRGQRDGHRVPKSPSSGIWRPTMMRPCRRSSRRVNNRRLPATWWRLRPGPGTASRNAPENTIARFPPSAYHGYMTSRQAPKRPGYMNPAPRLSAALAGGVVAW